MRLLAVAIAFALVGCGSSPADVPPPEARVCPPPVETRTSKGPICGLIDQIACGPSCPT